MYVFNHAQNTQKNKRTNGGENIKNINDSGISQFCLKMLSLLELLYPYTLANTSAHFCNTRQKDTRHNRLFLIHKKQDKRFWSKS